MDAYDFFVQRRMRYNDIENITKVESAYDRLDGYYPAALRYLEKMRMKYGNDENLVGYIDRVIYILEVEYKYRLLKGRIKLPVVIVTDIFGNEKSMLRFVGEKNSYSRLGSIRLRYGLYLSSEDEQFELLYKEVSIRKKKYVNEQIKKIYDLIYQRANTTKNNGIISMVNDAVFVLRKLKTDNIKDKQWKEDMLYRLETVYDTDKWDLNVVRR